MCGIAGILSLTGRPPDGRLLERMTAALDHRGPDAEGTHFDGPVALGHRRLSIIDLSDAGRQPLANEDDSVWVTFNGEIYNFQDLRARLEALGHRFRTNTDTEAIVHAYEQYGARCVERFRGMFAFAVWDRNRRTLFLARDRVGKKPLYYTTTDGQFLWASELQALLRHPGVPRDLDPTALDDYLTYGYIPAPRTIFRGVRKLPPACRLTLTLTEDGRSSIAEEQYWQLAYVPKLDLDEDEAVDGLLEVLTEAVKLRLIADVPLGALLSGGLDSSLVVALMAGLSAQPVKTFSVGFEEAEFNELPHARRVAERFGADHHELIVGPGGTDVLPTLVRHYGEPFADSSAVPAYHVARLTRRHVTVVLNGDGGDESFGGYERYLGHAWAEHYRRVPALIRRGVAGAAAIIPESLSRRSRLAQAKRFLQAGDLPPACRYLQWVSFFSDDMKRSLYAPELRQQLAGHRAEDWLAGLYDTARHGGGDAADTLLDVDVRSYLPFDLLVKMDIATMANSLEARSPLLDHKVMEFAAQLPGRFKLRGGRLKYLLKRVGARLLPPENIRRRKMGFGAPVGRWMRNELGPLVDDVLLSPRSLGRGYFRPEAVRHLVRTHRDGKRDLTHQIWALLWLELWHREFVDQ
jgi:asparagine synthase (glutamine-hydrolysing)